MKKLIIIFFLSIAVLPVFSQENIALGKLVTASSSVGNNTPGKMVNGTITGDRWESTQGLDNQWVEIDLGYVYDLISMKIYWETASAANYDIQVSKNAEDWDVVRTKTTSTQVRTDEFTFDSGEITEIRYIRLDLKTRTTIYGFSIYEWEIYGIESNVEAIATTLDIKPEDVVLLTDLPDELEILSLNNSLIDYNNQNELFNQLASAKGKTANWTKQTHLGQSLRYHYDQSTTSKALVASKHWTHIILQEQSSKPIDDFADFLASVKLWKEYIRASCPNPYAKIILYMNWPYCEENNGGTAVDFSGDMAQLYANYEAVAAELGVSICPVGKTFDLVRTIDGNTAKTALYTDNRHPSLLASYMSACTVYATLFGETPVGATYYPTGISVADAVRVQAHAWTAFDNHTDVVDDLKGNVHYVVQVLDQFNRVMTYNGQIIWDVSDGGNITDGIFTTNGTPGAFQVSAQAGDMKAQVALTVMKALKPGDVVDDYFVEIKPEDTYIQNFDEIGTEAIATLPFGWKIEKRLDAPRMLGSFSIAGTQTEQVGGNNMASDAKNGIYNFGTDVDRAIGGISTGIANGTRCINMYVKLKNTGTEKISGFNIQYDVEKYRKGLNSQGFVFQMYYSSDGQNWISAAVDFYTFFTADNETAGYSSVPGDVMSVEAELKQPVESGEVIYLAWNYSVASGTDAQAAQALALDNVIITPLGTTDLTHVEIEHAPYITENTLYLNKLTNTVALVNTTGQVILQASGMKLLDVSSLANGVYIVKTEDNVYKVVK